MNKTCRQCVRNPGLHVRVRYNDGRNSVNSYLRMCNWIQCIFHKNNSPGTSTPQFSAHWGLLMVLFCMCRVETFSETRIDLIRFQWYFGQKNGENTAIRWNNARCTAKMYMFRGEGGGFTRNDASKQAIDYRMNYIPIIWRTIAVGISYRVSRT